MHKKYNYMDQTNLNTGGMERWPQLLGSKEPMYRRKCDFFLWIRLFLWGVLLQTFVFGDQGKHWKWNDLYLISGVGLTETWIDPKSGHCTSQVQIDKDFDQP